MDFTDLLTIAMPCYERKEYFLEALESALNQTVKCKVIVIDNCSSHDFFEKVCKEKNVAYYRNNKNIGIAANFAKGFELAVTKYVMNLQDDDVLSPEYVESFLNAIHQYPDIDVFFTNFVRLTSNGELPHKHTLPFG
jgi:GT2 family glycosyltransferase